MRPKSINRTKQKSWVMSVLLSVMLLCLIIAACEDPAITNPADPNYELSPPTLLTAEAVTDVSIVLTWKNNEEHTKEFVISRKGTTGSFSLLATVDKAVLSYTDTTCVLGTNYSYVIQSKVETNVSGNSNVIQKGTSFAAPSNLNTVSISDESIRLTWTDNTGYEDGFKIERDAGSGYEEIGTVLANILEYTDTELIYGQSYAFRVAAYTSRITSDYSGSAIATACMHCMVDYDGNIYETIQIGDQVWMAENLKVTHYRDGTAITNVTDAGTWAALITEAICIYNNNASGEVDTYGALYNGYAVADSRNIAPEGWHVPTDEEWKALEMYLGMSQSEADDADSRGTNEGSKLAGNAGLWFDGALESDSEFGTSGFTALPGGYRNWSNGYYDHMSNYSFFWSATEFMTGSAWSRRLIYSYSDVDRFNYPKRFGFSVRLLRD